MAITGTLPLMGPEAAIELMQVVLGRARADLVIVNARLANVYTGELLDNQAIAVKGKWIAYVGREPEDNIGVETTVIDAQGMTVIPGLIDGHTHLGNAYNAAEVLRYVMKGGTTTLIAEMMDPYPVAGYEGVLDFLASFQDQPVKVFGTVPANVSISQACNGISLETLRKLLQRDDIVGLGESYWQALLQNPDQLLPLYEETLRCGKTVEGHSAGASRRKLMAYAAAGVSSCHEPTNAEEVLERLRLGIYVMVREGSVRSELDDVCRLKDMGVDLRRLTLVTDGTDPKDLYRHGHMNRIVQKAIDVGFEPMDAVRMATLNIAEHFSLDGLLGGIAPGKYADMLVIPDIKTIDARYVISMGKVVAKDGEVLIAPRKPVYAMSSRHTVNLPGEFKPEDFLISVAGGVSSLKVRVIDQVTELVTKELHLDLPVRDGEIKADRSIDIVKVAAIDRTHNPGKKFVGLLRGWHMQAGAFATSGVWDASDIVCVGVGDADMALAVNRIRELQGGIVVVQGGKIVAEIPLPIFGVISDLPMESLVDGMEAIEAALKVLGVRLSNPCLTILTLTTPAIPYLRICEEGLVNLKEGKTLGLVVE